MLVIDFKSIALELGCKPDMFCLWGCTCVRFQDGRLHYISVPTCNLATKLPTLQKKFNNPIESVECLVTDNVSRERVSGWVLYKKVFV